MSDLDITVDLRLNGAKGDAGKVKAYADVTISLGADGVVKISGFSIFVGDGGKLRVAPPARKGERRYFDVVTLMGRIHSLVESAVLAEYNRVMGGQTTG
jgi:DNA-binding cell septation regulator SpoVG